MFKVTVLTKDGKSSEHYFKGAYVAQEFARLAASLKNTVKAVVEDVSED